MYNKEEGSGFQTRLHFQLENDRLAGGSLPIGFSWIQGEIKNLFNDETTTVCHTILFIPPVSCSNTMSYSGCRPINLYKGL